MKLRHAPVVLLLLLVPGIAGCSCCGFLRLCGGSIDLHAQDPKPVSPCVEQYDKCFEACKEKPVRVQMEACQAVCAKEKVQCEQPPAR